MNIIGHILISDSLKCAIQDTAGINNTSIHQDFTTSYIILALFIVFVLWLGDRIMYH
jgi:hypothetical protein